MIQVGSQVVPFGKVSLPMYNLPEMRPANSAFWGALKVELSRLGVSDLPADLDFERRPVPDEIDADTLFTQVCGLPLQTIYRGQAALLAAPVYADAHCNGPTHCGIFIVGRDAPYQWMRRRDARGSER